MGRAPTIVFWSAAGILFIPLMALGGCDYWPPALQTEIDTLRAELNDVLDERQRVDLENSGLKSAQVALEREVEEKARENEALKSRLTALSRTAHQSISSTGRTLDTVGTAAKSDSASTRAATMTKSPFIPVRMEHAAAYSKRVLQIQRLLQRHGIRLHADGWYGPETEVAVRQFQRSHGLRADGIVGPATSVALHRTPRSVRLVRQLWLQQPALTGQDVVAIQRALRRAGYRVGVDGHYGPQTEVAVAGFQRTKGLYPDGVVGPRTWNALVRTTR
jgi:peptidoglycan hydrolase-like protein with peptidoglycan-binding domain